MIPLNVKYVLLTKEVDYKKYFFLFNQTDLELIKETENFYVFKNKHVVSRFYLSPEELPESFTSLSPLPYTQTSPVKFSIKAEAEYIVFVPPNLDSDYWELEGNCLPIIPGIDYANFQKKFWRRPNYDPEVDFLKFLTAKIHRPRAHGSE